MSSKLYMLFYVHSNNWRYIIFHYVKATSDKSILNIVSKRIVLGATAGNIVYMFSKEFIILIAIAFAIAIPIAWYFMHQWLQDYVYRINISWWIFAVGGLVTIIIALATISFQALKAALANPVKSLRTE